MLGSEIVGFADGSELATFANKVSMNDVVRPSRLAIVSAVCSSGCAWAVPSCASLVRYLANGPVLEARLPSLLRIELGMLGRPGIERASLADGNASGANG